MKRIAGLIVGLGFFSSSVHGQQPAFPGAEGGGKFSTGGRGGTVYEVTNLNDSGAGSLRDAISAPNRTVIFRVSGVIRLNSTLKFQQNNITVAGQTAPGDGICITGYTVSIQASNVIIRYIRSRLTDVTLIEDDAMHSMSGDYHDNIIDHCSLSWSVDETGTFYDIKNFTLQWCLLSESLYHSVHDKGDHGYAGIWGGNNATFHHNLLAHHTSRNPRFAGSRYTGKPAEEVVDFRNNVLYNWGNINSAYGGEGGNYNMVNNYYKPGPATAGSLTTSSTSNKRNRILNYTSYYYASDAAVYPDTLFGGKFYIDGNYVKGFPDVTADNWTRGVQRDSYSKAAQLIAAARQSSPFPTTVVTTQTAEQAYVSVLNSVGATFPVRDAVDKRIIKEVQTGTATYEGAVYGAINATGISHPSGIIDTQADVGGLPAYNSATAPVDTDHDGMPDAWENANSLNPNNAADGNTIGGDGYTNLEKYLNSLVMPIAAITPSGSPGNFNQTFGSASATQSYVVYGTNLTSDIVITPPLGYEVSTDGSVWYSNALPLTLSQAGGAVIETTVIVRLNAASVGSYSGNITHTTTGAGAAIPVAGITSSSITPPSGVAVTVAKDGSGNYTTVQAAIDAAPTGRTTPYVIYIRKGIYKEKITVPVNKPFLQLVGESVSNTILTYDDYSGKAMPGGGTFGTANSASVTVNAPDFTATNITFENTTGDAPQALAINVNADRAAFKNCRFLGGQDTVLTNGSGNRQHFRHCYIDGVVDFIFGNARAVFDSCVVYAKSRVDGLNASYITAANTQPDQTYGYVFRNATLPANTGVTKYVLGRPWQNASGFNPVSFPRVVFLNATIANNQVKPEGWSVWDSGTITSSVYYGEYHSKKFNGYPVDTGGRVNWSFQLSDTDAAGYTNSALFGSWDPCSVVTGFCDNVTSAIAVSNFNGVKGTTTSKFSWNLSWAMKDVRFELFKSSDQISYSKINEQVSVNDSTINFSYSENNPPAGATWYYYLVASKSGKDPHQTPVVQISSTPTILSTGSLNNFTQGIGTPSAPQVYSVSASNLTSDVTIKPPAGFEVSVNGNTWFTNASPLVLVQSSGSIPATSISVRLNGTTAGNYSGSILHSSTGATNLQIAVSGAVQQDPLAASQIIMYWPLTTNNQDDAGSRSAGVTASTSSLKKLFLSNGTTVAGVPAYSTSYGQAFGPGTGGEALWSVANGGPGGNLNRGIYEQFTVTAAAGYTVRVDSIVLKSSFYNTSSNTKLAIVYSKTGFTTNDSTSVTGGTGPDGQPLLSTANGAFATPVLLTNETGGTTVKYGFAFSGGAGILLNAGQTLTIRLYFSCGSTSTGRYGKVKDVYMKGFAALKPVVSTSGTLTTFSQILESPSAVQSFSMSGANLKGDVVMTPPVNFEISNGGTVWKNSTNPLTLSPVSGSIPSTTISARLNASVRGTFSGNIVVVSTGADNVNVALTGTVTDPVTGIESQAAVSVTVSPNPAGSFLVVHHPSSDVDSGISVFSVLGQRMKYSEVPALATETRIALEDMRPGLYIIEWISREQRTIVRFVKQ